MTMTGNIMIMAGGTGGHVFPALAVAEQMRSLGWDVSWLGTHKGLENRVVSARDIIMDRIDVHGIRGKSVLSKLTAIGKLLTACLAVRRILKQRRPDVVLGMGGFVAGPGGLMAKLLGIRLIIHEQNRIPGSTNRLLAIFAASKVLQAFPNSFATSVKAVTTGNPLRKSFMEFPEKSLWTPESGRALRILIVGGSQGAKVLNDTVPAALAELSDIEIKHQTGDIMQAEVIERYHSLAVDAEVIAFIEDMPAAYLWADLLICRAGAMTVSEVAACGLPAIFVPLLHAIDDHQTANARFLSEAGAAVLLPQTQLTVDSLRNAVTKIMTDLVTMSQAAKNKSRRDATLAVADICIKEAAL